MKKFRNKPLTIIVIITFLFFGTFISNTSVAYGDFEEEVIEEEVIEEEFVEDEFEEEEFEEEVIEEAVFEAQFEVQSSASVTPIELPGNDKDIPDNYIGGLKQLKIDPPNDGTYSEDELTVTVSFDEDGKFVNWSSNIPINYVFVKGGNGGYLYYYPQGATGDEYLRAPDNNGGNQAQISHVSFFFNPEDPVDDPEDPVDDPDDDIVTITEEDIPLAAVQEVIEEITLTTVEETEIEEEEIPLGAAALPQTGEASPTLLYGLGSLLAFLGAAMRRRS